MKLKWPYLAIAGSILIIIAFQNCQNGGFTAAIGSSDSDTNKELGVLNNAEGLSAEEQLVDSGGSQSEGNQLVAVQTANAMAGSDCSNASANMSVQIQNAGSDILICQEFVLDMPAGNSRYGESYNCDSSNKFVTPGSSWSYDQANKKWSHPQINLKNHEIYVPGSYKLVVKNAQGVIYKSAAAVIKKQGSGNCFAAAATPTCYYQWEVYYASGEKQIFAGVQNTPQPANGKSCSSVNEGETTTDLNSNNAQGGVNATLKCEKSCY